MQKRIVCENLRSAYNVWNIIRTADGLGRWVILVGYTAPKDHKKVSKTALWAEENVPIKRFDNLNEFHKWVIQEKLCLIAAEKNDMSVWLDTFFLTNNNWEWVALVMGNEVTWVEEATLNVSDYIVHIPMIWTKESFNVGQAAAIFMREYNKIIVTHFSGLDCTSSNMSV